MRHFAIIVAGGQGTRMGSEIPKQFLLLDNKPILAHTIERFHEAMPDIEIIVVLPESSQFYWQEYLAQGTFSIPNIVANGGKTRTESVRNGLKLVPNDALVAIHDAVRPLIAPSIIVNSFEVAHTTGTAITAVTLKDSIRVKAEDGSFHAVNRDHFRIIQTPQTFQSTLIKHSYSKLAINDVSDDATVAELAGYAITLINGSYENIKITTPEDLIMAEGLLNRQKQ